MKVRAWVETAQEIEVDVSIDDVIAEISSFGEPKSAQAALPLLSTCIGVVMKVPDEIVAAMSEAQRKIVAGRLREQAERFAG